MIDQKLRFLFGDKPVHHPRFDLILIQRRLLLKNTDYSEPGKIGWCCPGRQVRQVGLRICRYSPGAGNKP
jgi:hypothetical protein